MCALNPKKTKLDTDISNERLVEMFLNSKIKWIYNLQFQNDKYFYTSFIRYDNQNSLQTNVFYDKRNHKTFVFEKFKEDLTFYPFFGCMGYAANFRTQI